MRIYVAVDTDQLSELAAGASIDAPAFRGQSEEEEDELAALEEAAEHGRVVVAADVDGTDEVTLDDVAALHVDLDGTGDLAWFAAQEIDAVLRIVQAH